MTSIDHTGPDAGLAPDAVAEMTKYGVTRVPADVFLVGGYRYTNLQDAIAEAKRRTLAHAGP